MTEDFEGEIPLVVHTGAPTIIKHSDFNESHEETGSLWCLWDGYLVTESRMNEDECFIRVSDQ